MASSLKNTSCNTPLDLKTDRQAKVYMKIKKLIDEEGYCLISIKDFSFEYILHLREELKRKFRACSRETDEKTKYNGMSKLDSIPTEAIKIQTSPGMHALFSTLLGSKEIFNAFDIPQVVARGEHQHYKGLNIFGCGYVGLLTLTYQTLANGVGVPEGTLIIYDSIRGASLLAPNSVKLVQRNKSSGWLGLRFTFWKEDIFDARTRNALYLTGGFGIHVPLDRPRRILPDRVALLQNKLVRHTCLAKESWEMTVNNIIEEAEHTILIGEPFPSQLLWNPEKKKIQFQHKQTATRCPHPDCERSNKVYVNLKLHMSSKHSKNSDTPHIATQRREKNKKSTIQKSFDKEMEDRNDYVPNIPTKRSFDEDETNTKKHCTLQQERQVKYTFPSKNVGSCVNRESFQKVCENRRNKRLSLKKKAESRSSFVPTDFKKAECYEMTEALNEMTNLSPPISPLHLSPEFEVLEEMSSFSPPISPNYEDEDEELEEDLLHTTIDFRDLYDDATEKWRKILHGDETDQQESDETSSDDSSSVCNERLGESLTPKDSGACYEEEMKLLPRKKQHPPKQKSPINWRNMYEGEWKLKPIDENLLPKRKSFRPWIDRIRDVNQSDERNPTQEPYDTDPFFSDMLQDPVDHDEISMELDRLDDVLKQTSINLENGGETQYETNHDEDILEPLRGVLDNHSYSEDRDFDAEKYRVNIKPNEFGKCPTQMDLEYDRSINLMKTDDSNHLAIFKRHYLSWNKNLFLRDYIFCNISGFRDITPDIMFTDDAYRKLRCYMKTKTDNSAYEIRGARTLIEALKIFYLGMQEIKSKTTERKTDRVKHNKKWCFMLADSNEALNSVTEGKVYEVIRIPYVGVNEDQHHLVYPDWRCPSYEAPDFQYLPFQDEPKLARGIRSVVSIPSQTEEKTRMLSDFLYNEFQKKFNHQPDKGRCQRLASLLFTELARLPLNKVNVRMPPMLDDLIKEHQEARMLITKYAVNILLDPRSQGSMMDKIKAIAFKQLLMMQTISQETSNIQVMYKPVDDLKRTDIFLLGIIVHTDEFISGLRLCEDHKQ